jgi:peptidoglycan/LPS O-acetylase OafA/YrhL
VSLRDFYALRVARIGPLLLLLLVVLCTLHAVGLRHFVVAAESGGVGRALLAALTFHINVLEARHGYLPANWDILWSLSVEEMFYLFFPAVCRLLGGSRWLLAFLMAFVALGPPGRTVFAHGNEIWQEYSYLGGMDAIALGCLTAIAVSRATLTNTLTRVIGWAGAALMLLILCCSNEVEAWGVTQVGLDMTILAIGTCMVMAAAAQSGWSSPRILSPLVKLGQRSYEVYLAHMFVVFALFALFQAAGQSIQLVPVFFIGTILIAGVLGESIARLYSEPLNRLIRRRLGDGPDKLGSAIGSTGAA